MSDENPDALRTPLGRERMLETHEDRLDGLEKRMTKIEGKEASRDKLRDLTIRSVITLAGGIIVGIVVALFTTGVHL